MADLEFSSEKAAELAVQTCSLFVLPHYAEELEAGKAEVAALEGDAKFARAKDLLATCVLNFFVNKAVEALVEQKEREAAVAAAERDCG